MATVATPNGLVPQKHYGGLPFAGATVQIPIASAYGTAIGAGDPVIVVTAGTIQKETGTTSVTTGGVWGVFVGCSYTDPNLKYKVFRTYWPASTVASDAVAYVCDDPNAVFQIQADGSVAQTALNANAGFTQTAVDTTYGVSRISLASASIAVTATLPLRIVGFVTGPFSAVGDTYTDCLVRWNFGAHFSTVALAP